MSFKKYQHVERFGTPEVEGIEFGEWLVPHSLKTYKETSWRNFYVFDVTEDLPDAKDSSTKYRHLHYNEYKPLLSQYNINYIPPISIITNGTYEQFVNQLSKNVYLIEDGNGAGEGIVIKNYDFKNGHGRTRWAKIVTSEFKEKHAKAMGASEIKGRKMVEEGIAKKYTTKALCEKVLAKIENDGGFDKKKIPRLLNTIYYDLVREESWNFVKENKYPTINFRTLQHFCFSQIRENLPHIFN